MPSKPKKSKIAEPTLAPPTQAPINNPLIGIGIPVGGGGFPRALTVGRFSNS
jgi:hypothetical protein